MQAYKALKKLDPDLIIATGGFVTAPVLAAARWIGIPYVMHEQNRVMGKVNLLFASHADKVFGTFEGTLRLPKKINWEVVGNPVKNYNLKQDVEDMVIFLGGSGGSDEINEMALNFAINNPGVDIIVQTGMKEKMN